MAEEKDLIPEEEYDELDLIPEEECNGLEEVLSDQLIDIILEWKGPKRDCKKIERLFREGGGLEKFLGDSFNNVDRNHVYIDENELSFSLSERPFKDDLWDIMGDAWQPWCAEDFPKTKFHLYYSDTCMRGVEHFVYAGGEPVQNYFVINGIGDQWALNKIAFSGSKEAVKKLRTAIIKEKDSGSWGVWEGGVHLALYNYYYPYYYYPDRDIAEWQFPLSCEICDGEIADDHIIFYSLETWYEEGVLTHSLFLFKKLAEAFPEVDFEMSYYMSGRCEADGKPFVETVRFHAGVCTFREKNKDEEAIASFESGIPEAVKHKDTFYRYGSAWTDPFEGDDREDEDASEEDDDEDNPYDLAAQAVARREEGNYDEALGLHDTVIQLRPEDGAAWSGRGWTYFLKGDYEKALADMDEALRLEPGNSQREERRAQILEKLRPKGG